MYIFKKNLFALITILSFIRCSAQLNFSLDPDSAVFVTRDIPLFWQCFDAYLKDSTKNPFGRYLKDGSAGVQGFIPYRIKSDTHLYQTVGMRSKDYMAVRSRTDSMRLKEKQCRSSFYALKYWYPAAQFPPVYFVIGAFNSGGTFNENGIFIGAEMQPDVRGIPYIVAHELIHFQQTSWKEYPTLLEQSIVEGSASFLGELISGEHATASGSEYVKKHKDRLCREFVSKMDTADYRDWIYGLSGKDDRPRDLGYWMGYEITKAYFDKSKKKTQAVYEILHITDYKDFLRKSGYLDIYLR